MTSPAYGSGLRTPSLAGPASQSRPRPQVRRAVRRARAWSVLDAAFLTAVAAFVLLQSQLEALGGALYVAFLAICIAYVALKKDIVLILPLAGMTALGVVYIGLSYLHVLPDAWTLFYVPEAIPQQASFVVALYPLVLASRSFFATSIASGRTRMCGLIILLCYIVHLILVLGLDSVLINWRIAGFTNNIALVFCSIVLLTLHARSSTRHAVILLAAVAILLLSQTSQAVIVGLALIAACWSLARPYLVPGLVVSSVAVTLAAMFYIPEVWRWDPNTGVRLLFWRDALMVLADTWGAGIGFGKEAIRNYYLLVDHEHVAELYGSSSGKSLIFTGVHNSFLGVPMRLGLLGLVFMIWYFLLLARTASRRRSRFSLFLACLLAIFYVTVFTNVSIESPTLQVGMAFISGLVLALGDVPFLRTPAGRDEPRRGRSSAIELPPS